MVPRRAAEATASAAISAFLGYQDGEKIKRSTLIDLTGRIACSVEVPVTAGCSSYVTDYQPSCSRESECASS
jgi:hypothetical protein